MEKKRRERVDYGSGSDRISQLTEHVLVHILCFLSQKQAVQTCVLSKSWRHLGLNRPVIDLRRTDFRENNGFNGNKKTFISVLDDTFQRYHHQNIFTQELRLDKLEVNSESISLLDKWIPMFVKPNTRVTTFHLSFHTCPAEFDLPSVVFQAESLREIRLHGCRLSKINSIHNVLLKNLQKLTLFGVDIADEALEKIISGCPLLKYLVLRDCDGLKTFSITKNKNRYLRHFEFSSNLQNVEHYIEIDVPTLRELYLDGCWLNKCISIDNVELRNLQKLSLTDVCIDDDTLEKILSGCPSVDYVALVNCKGLKTVNIVNKNHYLKHFEFSCDGETTEHSIEIDVPTLQSIRIMGCSKWYHNHNNSFPHLKSLYLSQVQLSTASFHNFSCNFPRLEELTFIYCRGFDEIKLSSCSIKRLTIQLITSIKKVAIHAPNIVYFEFSDWFLPTALSIATTNSREWKSHLSLLRCADAYELIETVKALSQSQISLTISEALFLKIEQVGCAFIHNPVVVEHLILSIISLCPDSLPQLLNALFCVFRPRYAYALHAYQNDDKEVTQFLWKTLMHERKKREYGWEEHLEEVSIEASDEKGKVWHRVEWTCLPESSNNQRIRFRLKWRD